jgi:hypothetical protein
LPTPRKYIRSYDLVIRYSGDEFLCGLLGLQIADPAGLVV